MLLPGMGTLQLLSCAEAEAFSQVAPALPGFSLAAGMK